MNEWAMFIIFINNRLDKLCGSLEQKIENKALDFTEPALRVFDEINMLNKLKIRLINLRVLHNYIKEALTAVEFDALSTAGQSGQPPETDACENNAGGRVSRSALCRRRARALKKCVSLLSRLGYTREKFTAEYPSYAQSLDRILERRARDRKNSFPVAVKADGHAGETAFSVISAFKGFKEDFSDSPRIFHICGEYQADLGTALIIESPS